jgi:hypothetical protein
MSRTIPLVPTKGDYLSVCHDCGFPYLRRDLVRGSDGKLRCPVDAPGRNELELAQESAMNIIAAAAAKDTTPADGAAPLLDADGRPSVSDYEGPVQRYTEADVYLDRPPETF